MIWRMKQQTRSNIVNDRSTATPVRWFHASSSWQFIALRFVPTLALVNLIWEIAHLPLYTIWRQATAAEIAFAVVHCTLGDVVIGISALFLALTITQAKTPPTWPRWRIAWIATAFSVAYTMFSE
jgi:hypothetical protein